MEAAGAGLLRNTNVALDLGIYFGAKIRAAAKGTDMTFQNILVETHDRVGLIRLNRPQALNALNSALIDEVNGVLDGFEADPGIGCVVITGSDKAFAAGADIKEMQSKTYMEAYLSDFITKWERISRARTRRVLGCRAPRAGRIRFPVPAFWVSPELRWPPT